MPPIHVRCTHCDQDLILTPPDVTLVQSGYQWTCPRCHQMNCRHDQPRRTMKLLREAGCDNSIPRDEAGEFIRALYGEHFDLFVRKLVAWRCPVCGKHCTGAAEALVHGDQAHWFREGAT